MSAPLRDLEVYAARIRALFDVLADLDRARPVFHDSARTANCDSDRPARGLAPAALSQRALHGPGDVRGPE